MADETDKAVKDFQSIGSMVNGLIMPVMGASTSFALNDFFTKYAEEHQNDSNQAQVNAGNSINEA